MATRTDAQRAMDAAAQVHDTPGTRRDGGDDLGIERVADGTWSRRLAFASVVVAVVPVVTAAVRAIQRGWVPIGDNAYFAFRSRDVFSSHFPLLGTWTSASQTTGINVNNPGPLFFDLLAVPVKLFNHEGLVVGVMLLNVASIIAIAAVARRRGGAKTVVAAMAMCAVLAWTVGSELLFEPWQPHAMIFPFLCLVVLVWSLACGDVALLPWTVVVASLVLQTHLSYAELVPLLMMFGAGSLAWLLWRRRRDDPDLWPGDRRRVLRAVIVSGVALAVLWAPPLVEEVRHGDDGNLTLLVKTIGKAKDTVGLNIGTRATASVVAVPPWWLRPSFGEAFVPPSGTRPPPGMEGELVPSTAASVIGLTVLFALVAIALWIGRRSRDRTATAALWCAVVAVGGAWITAVSLPLGSLGIAPHQFRFLWPIGVFTAFAVVLSVVRRVPVTRTPVIVAGFACLTVGLSAWNVPKYNQHTGPSADEAAIAPVRDLISQLGSLDGKKTLLMDVRGLRFAEPWDAPVIDELIRRGHDVRVDDVGMVRQLGPARAFDGTADGRLFLVEGPNALLDQPGATRVALHVDLDANQQAELRGLRDDLSSYLSTHPVTLTPSGRDALANGHLPALAAGDQIRLLEGDQIREMFANAWIDADGQVAADMRRYAELQHRLNLLTVGLFVAPLP